MKARFITIEGIEGAGKTTSLKFIHQHLIQLGKRVVATREPGGTALSERIRSLLLGHQHAGMAADTELLLMFAARAEHLAQVIYPALAAGEWVLSDRFTDATYAYQGGGRGIPETRIAVLENWAQGDLRPDLTLLLDLPVHIGLERTSQRSLLDRFEREQVAFFERVREAYLQQAHRHADRYHIIDASQSPAGVETQIKHALNKSLS